GIFASVSRTPAVPFDLRAATTVWRSASVSRRFTTTVTGAVTRPWGPFTEAVAVNVSAPWPSAGRGARADEAATSPTLTSDAQSSRFMARLLVLVPAGENGSLLQDPAPVREPRNCLFNAEDALR